MISVYCRMNIASATKLALSTWEVLTIMQHKREGGLPSAKIPVVHWTNETTLEKATVNN